VKPLAIICPELGRPTRTLESRAKGFSVMRVGNKDFQSSSTSRFTAGAFGFLTLTQCAERPETLLFDYLIGSRMQLIWDGQSKRLGGSAGSAEVRSGSFATDSFGVRFALWRLENSFVHAAFSRFARCCFLQALFNQFRRHLLSACLYWMRLEYSTRRGLYSAITLPCAGAPMPNWHGIITHDNGSRPAHRPRGRDPFPRSDRGAADFRIWPDLRFRLARNAATHS